MPLLHGRHVGPLISIWVTAIVLASGLYALQRYTPVVTDLLTPIYIIIGIAALSATWKWVRERAYHRDRRMHDRRRTDRRDYRHRVPGVPNLPGESAPAPNGKPVSDGAE